MNARVLAIATLLAIGAPGAQRAPAQAAEAGAVLIDRFVPKHHFQERQSIRVRATPEQVYRAIRGVTPSEIRMLPTVLKTGALGPAMRIEQRAMKRPALELAPRASFVVLGERSRREIVLGSIGQYWNDRAVRLRSPGEFQRYRRPGYAKTAVNVVIQPERDGWTRVTTETRVACTDRSALRPFGTYWRLGTPARSLLRHEWLGAIKRRAERAA